MSGDAAATYQAGDKVYVKLTDSDRNGDSEAVETMDVKITSRAIRHRADSGNTWAACGGKPVTRSEDLDECIQGDRQRERGAEQADLDEKGSMTGSGQT